MAFRFEELNGERIPARYEFFFFFGKLNSSLAHRLATVRPTSHSIGRLSQVASVPSRHP